VGALSVGAFQLNGGGGIEAGASASISVANVGGKTNRQQSLLRQAGTPDRCGDATDQAPAPDCRSPIQMFLFPVREPGSENATPGMVKAEFVSAEGDLTWQVVSDDKVLCETPCSKYVHPAQSLTMRERGAGFFSLNKAPVLKLRDHAAEAPLLVQ